MSNLCSHKIVLAFYWLYNQCLQNLTKFLLKIFSNWIRQNFSRFHENQTSTNIVHKTLLKEHENIWNILKLWIILLFANTLNLGLYYYRICINRNSYEYGDWFLRIFLSHSVRTHSQNKLLLPKSIYHLQLQRK